MLSQTYGVFFVWKKCNKKIVTTFLRNRENIPLEIQIENAITDGRNRAWTLVGIGHWFLQPLEANTIEWTMPELSSVQFTVYNVAASLLRLKNLPERELQSTEIGTQEMREKWIPYICEHLRQTLWGYEN